MICETLEMNECVLSFYRDFTCNDCVSRMGVNLTLQFNHDLYKVSQQTKEILITQQYAFNFGSHHSV